MLAAHERAGLVVVDGGGDEQVGELELLDGVGAVDDERVDERAVEAVGGGEHDVQRRVGERLGARARECVEQVEGLVLLAALRRRVEQRRRRRREKRLRRTRNEGAGIVVVCICSCVPAGGRARPFWR
eukprot:6206364-Pleurochrysis_carterae.AAC.2